MNEVCAIIVTHNRKDLLLRNINSLLKQKYPLDILVYDNASTDGTKDYMEEHGLFERGNIIYIYSDLNSGGAGGFKHGAVEGFKRGYNFLWLMDDDGYCLNEYTLQNLMNEVKSNHSIYNSYVTYDTENYNPTFSIDGKDTREAVLNAATGKTVSGGCPYNGTLIPRQCFEEIGFNDERLFIYGDEVDYYYRSKEAGYHWYTCIDSLYYHPINRDIIKTVKLGKFEARIKNQPIWKYYLDIRNAEVNAIRHLGKSKSALSGYFRVIIIALNSRNKRIKRIKYGIIAMNDAKRENFNRPIMFEE